jgi:glucose-6-phosphate 1-dehydrogenase
MEDLAIRKDVIPTIEKRMTRDHLAELQAIFYIGRDHIFAEYYEREVEETKKNHAARNDPKAEIEHLLEKSNFLHCIQLAATKLGRLSLVGRLAQL